MRAALAIALLSLTACAPSSAEPQPDYYNGELIERTITLDDGRDITCVVFKVDRGGGVSCDWRGADQ